jgi:hypothetical protein
LARLLQDAVSGSKSDDSTHCQDIRTNMDDEFLYTRKTKCSCAFVTDIYIRVFEICVFAD